MPTETTYSIADLARLTGLNVRTIRYYIAQGLIPGSGESGPGAHYGSGHLDRLTLTKRLQQQHLPLAEIRARLESLSDEDVAELVATAPPRDEPAPTSALEYIRGVLGEPAPARAPAASRIAPRVQAPAQPAHELAIASLAEARPYPAAPAAGTPERSQWERHALGPNIEIHVRRPLSRVEQRRVERLITIARQVLKEDGV